MIAVLMVLLGCSSPTMGVDLPTGNWSCVDTSQRKACTSTDHPEVMLEVNVNYCDAKGMDGVDGAAVLVGMRCEHPSAACFGTRLTGIEMRQYWTPQASYHVAVTRPKQDKSWKLTEDLIAQVRFHALEEPCNATGKPCTVELGEWKGPELGRPAPKMSFKEIRYRCRTPPSER